MSIWRNKYISIYGEWDGNQFNKKDKNQFNKNYYKSEIITTSANISAIMMNWIGTSQTQYNYNQEVLERMEQFGDKTWNGNNLTKREFKSHHNKRGICPYCKERIAKSPHHIIPRKYDGENISDNIIFLCGECHDYIEIKTGEWIESGKYYNKDLFKMLILNDGI